MRILITGIPGSGKTTLAEKLSKSLNLTIYSDKEFLDDNNSIQVTYAGSTLRDVDVIKLQDRYKSIKSGVFEGILFPEMSLKFDYIVILEPDESIIKERLKERGYNDLKIEDNLYSQNIGYLRRLCKKRSNRILIVHSSDENTLEFIVKFINSY